MAEKLALFGGNPLVLRHQDLRIDWPLLSERTKNLLIKRIEARDFSGRGSPAVADFENYFSKQYCRYATGVHSATAALHAALYSVGIEPGDEVIVPNFTFVATAMAVLHSLAVPVFVDIDPVSFNIDPEGIKSHITPRTKAIIVVHMQGMPSAMNEIMAICEEYGLKLIEDVAQAPGALYHGKLVGTFGDAAAFSFMSQKNIASCGECGLLLTKTLEQKNRIEMLRIYGEVVKPNSERTYRSYSLGWNYTLGPLEATMAKTSAEEYMFVLEKLQTAGRKLTEGLKKFSWIVPPKEPKDITSAFHFYRVRLRSPDKTVDDARFRKAVQDALNAEGLNVRHYQNVPVSEQLIFKQQNAFGKGLPWSLNKDVNYQIAKEMFPNTLEMLNTTFVLGAIGSAPAYLLCPGTIEKYIDGFKKIDENIEELLIYATQCDYREPWDSVPVTSDSFSTTYE